MKRLKRLQESLPTEDFTPRDYQLDLLEAAKNRNTIAAVGADGGKTFLAVCLLRELVLDARSRFQRLSKASFDTQKVHALICLEADEAVDDYVRCIGDHTDLMAMALSSKSTGKDIRGIDVLVCTHANFWKCYKKKLLDLSLVGLFVIDECSAAIQKYQYSALHNPLKIGTELGTLRILGLISSLLSGVEVNDPEVLRNMICGIEGVWHSDLRTSVSLISIDRFGYKKDVRIIPYDLTIPEKFRESIFIILRKLQELESFISLCFDAATNKTVKVSETLEKVGSLRIFKVAASETLECLRVLGLWPTYRLVNIIQRDLKQVILKNLMDQRVLRLVMAVCTRFQEIGIFMEKSFGFHCIAKGDVRILDFVSEKLRAVVELLEPYNPQNAELGTPCIPAQYLTMLINVRRPYLVWAINRFLRDLKGTEKNSRYSYVSSSFCLGSFTSGEASPDASHFGMPFKVQEEMLRRFRNRDFNILVSTCTNDMSLDVPHCTFTVEFDEVLDYTTFISARHRTKSKYGTLCILVRREREEMYRKEYYERFRNLDTVVLSRCPDYLGEKEAPPTSVEHEMENEVVTSKDGKARVTIQQAIGLINRYCSNLPSDAFANLTPLATVTQIPSPESYQCRLTLPINSPWKKAFLGKPMPTRQLAKQSAALEACRKLYQIGELDESLLPVSKDHWKTELAKVVALDPPEVVDPDAPKPGTTKRRQYYDKKILTPFRDSLLKPDSPAFLYAIEMTLVCPVPQEQNVKGRTIHRPQDANRIFGILSSNPIPSIPDFNLYDRSGENTVVINAVASQVILTEYQLEMVHHFHRLVFSNVLLLERFSVAFEPENALCGVLIVALGRGDSNETVVDWPYMERVFSAGDLLVKPVPESSRDKFSMERFADAVVMPWYRSVDQPQTFYVEQICPWLTPDSEFPDDDFPSFGAYYRHKYKLNVVDKEQPLLDVDHTSNRLNLLLPRFLTRKGSSLMQTDRERTRDKETRHRQILIPEFCQVHPIPASLWRQGICLPTVLHRLQCLLVMEELLTTVRLETGIGSLFDQRRKWPMLDYGWSFEEKVRNLEGSHVERDDDDEKTVKVIEAAKVKHERQMEEKKKKSATKFPTIEMWNPNDVSNSNGDFEIGSWDAGGDFKVDTWNPNAVSGDGLVIDTWNGAPTDDSLELEDAPAISFFDHVKDAYLDGEVRASGKALKLKKKEQLSMDFEMENGFGANTAEQSFTDWGNFEDSQMPGVSVLSGFSDNVMQAISDDLTNLSLDDSGMIAPSEIDDDTTTIADSIMTTLPAYNLEAMDPLKDNEEEEIGPVISSILHLRFSESAPEDLRNHVVYQNGTALTDVFEEMSDFQMDNANEKLDTKPKKTVTFRTTEFGEVARGPDGPLSPSSPRTVACLKSIIPKVRFDDERDPAYVSGPDPGILLQAFTASNANDGINFERLETVGDSFLKFSMTAYLYFRYTGYHEGKLSFMRSLQVSNYNLYRLGFKKEFGTMVIGSKFEPTENWLPPGYILTDDGMNQVNVIDGQKIVTSNLRTQHCVADKTLADCVESLIGAYLVTSGVKAAQLVMAWLGLTVLPLRQEGNEEVNGIGEEKKNCLTERFTWFAKPETVLLDNSDAGRMELERLLDGYQKFEERIGYRFNDRAYLLQAFTHASYTYNRVTDCYQRLEFLGDAVLDYLITRHLYEDFGGHSPGALTDLRSALVNNAIFASLSVRYEFHKYIKLLSPAIFHLVEKYVKEQRERDQNVTLFTEDIFFYDPAVDEDMLEDEGGAEETECPKVLGDVFESVAGAIYLDSGMSLDAVWKVYYAMMKSEIDECTKNIPKSPVRELLELEPENVKFGLPERTAMGKIRVAVEIFDKGKFIGFGRNYRTAKCTAAKQALKYLRSLEERIS